MQAGSLTGTVLARPNVAARGIRRFLSCQAGCPALTMLMMAESVSSRRPRLGALGPGHRADQVGGDQRAVGRIPQQHGARLGQRDQCSHGPATGGDHVPLVILGHDHDLEPAVFAVGPGPPVGVDDLYPSCLLACAWHDIQ